MIKRKVRLKIITASRETFRFRNNRLSRRCAVCERDVEMITSTEAAGVLEVDLETLHGLVAGGRVHTIQSVTGVLRVCKDSLFAK